MEMQGNKADSLKMIRQLQKENKELQRLAETDWLTGLYHRGAMERKVNALLKKRHTGTIIVFDLDGFKQVNDRYGHIVGDQFLQLVGDVLTKMFSRDALPGRVEGDEFAIFSPYASSAEEMDAKCARIRERFRDVQLPGGVRIRMSMTIAWADASKCGDYEELFDLADQQVLEKKRMHLMEAEGFYRDGEVELKAVSQDMRLIVKDLNEKFKDEGAYCQDYETFRRLFRLEMRRMKRKELDVYLILFTLTDKDNHFITISQRDREMEILGEEIRRNLRLGDVYTQYSSCQYLVMVSDVIGKYIDVIAERIRQAYYGRHDGEPHNLMLHRGYPMRPPHQATEP